VWLHAPAHHLAAEQVQHHGQVQPAFIGGNIGDVSVGDLWRIYKNSSAWRELAPNTQTDYTQCSKQLLRVFGDIAPSDVTPAHCARYLRVERADAPKRANREMALMSNLMNLAVERGEIVANPCKQVRRNRETPRDEAPEPSM
jgi:hypothetical protein